MKISKRLQLTAVASISLVVVLCAVLFSAIVRIRSEDRKESIAVELLRNLYERATLRDEYLFRHEERASLQWQAKRRQFRDLLLVAEQRFRRPEAKATLAEMRANFEDGESLVRGLLANTQQTAEDPAFAHEVENRLASQLLIKSYNMLSAAVKLQELSDRASASAQSSAVAFAILFVLAMMTTVSWLSLSMSRLIAGRIRKLQKGAGIIGRGELDYRIKVEGSDELSELSLSINEAAEKLKSSYEALEDSERRFRAAAEGSMDAFFLLRAVRDKEGRITDFDLVDLNAKAEKMLDLPRDLARGRKLSELDGQGMGGSFEKLVRVLETGRTLEEELPAEAREAGERWLRHQIVPLGGSGVAVSTRDITEPKLAEQEIRRLNEDLKHNVAQLRAVNRELESFSYSISHDLRAPLRHITGFVELLNKDFPEGLDPKGRHYLQVISDSARRMGQLVDDLLSFSRMGRAEMLRRQVDLEGLAREAIRELQDEAKDRKVEWKLAPLPRVFGDAAMLRQVFSNLLSNALKFTRGRQQPVIEVGADSDAPEAEHVIYVKDNGVGFDQRYADKLFSLFQRLHRVEEFEGTGVGLANVNRIIQRHGGRTWAAGAVDQGATFYFSLPKAKREEA
jgi:signal transduction histidine kinase/HAMP domain-containing protein